MLRGEVYGVLLVDGRMKGGSISWKDATMEQEVLFSIMLWIWSQRDFASSSLEEKGLLDGTMLSWKGFLIGKK